MPAALERDVHALLDGQMKLGASALGEKRVVTLFDDRRQLLQRLKIWNAGYAEFDRFFAGGCLPSAVR